MFLKMSKYFVGRDHVPFTIHQVSQWNQTEPIIERLHLNGRWRIRLGGAVVHHFQSEISKKDSNGQIDL